MGKVLQMEAEPQGMEREAQLLGELAEIPGISGAWVAPSGQNGHRITVRTAACFAAYVYYQPAHTQPISAVSHNAPSSNQGHAGRSV